MFIVVGITSLPRRNFIKSSYGVMYFFLCSCIMDVNFATVFGTSNAALVILFFSSIIPTVVSVTSVCASSEVIRSVSSYRKAFRRVVFLASSMFSKLCIPVLASCSS